MKKLWTKTLIKTAATIKETTVVDQMSFVLREVRRILAQELDKFSYDGPLPSPSPFETAKDHHLALTSRDPLLHSGPRFLVSSTLLRPLASQAIHILRCLGCQTYTQVDLASEDWSTHPPPRFPTPCLISDAPVSHWPTPHNYKGDVLFDLALKLPVYVNDFDDPLWTTHQHTMCQFSQSVNII
eukprot:Blabericola_migrator_1__8056@NODE_4138_length_1313_cov_76_260032_g2560_i0_p1_GENE_NODE_4138_length_1313_cov_76_260032_g2560_i0NODE_4138_length_1313_cov_76_260032_g2560_i0_p1_ORF_typecomplete_len184_score23_09_NODE_4138_length_1313_cov_76_260032_g2560_i07281279